jgi:hypothetical protein
MSQYRPKIQKCLKKSDLKNSENQKLGFAGRIKNFVKTKILRKSQPTGSP